MTEIELNERGVQFSYEDAQKAYKMLGIRKGVEDYPRVINPDDDDDGDYDAFFNDFDKWWKGLKKETKESVYEEVVGKKLKMARDARMCVAAQIHAMIENDILSGYGVESFVGWCDDGEVFFLNGIKGYLLQECIAIMNKVAPIVDNLVMNHLNPNL